MQALSLIPIDSPRLPVEPTAILALAEKFVYIPAKTARYSHRPVVNRPASSASFSACVGTSQDHRRAPLAGILRVTVLLTAFHRRSFAHTLFQPFCMAGIATTSDSIMPPAAAVLRKRSPEMRRKARQTVMGGVCVLLRQADIRALQRWRPG
ncbi:hypothetical protein KCP74_05795 [Salmonella enterica subsp. enterica]|nr:hypothetical protein KCP74_05795 [Salmonella enterica subsp. enterica]